MAMNRWIYTIIISAVLAVLFAVSSSHSTPVIAGGNNGSIDTVSDCSHVNDNQFYAGDIVKGRGSNFDTNSDYQWTITKVDQPSQNTQVANGSFSLGNVSSFCYSLWTANIVGGDTHSEFKWEVDEKDTDKDGNVKWKKVDSDNFFVDPAQVTPTPTTIPTSIPTPTPTIDPCANNACVTPTATPTQAVTPTTAPTTAPTVTPTSTPSVTPTVTVTNTPTATPTPTVVPTTTTNNGGGDGLSDGKSSCPECTQTPHTQGVLGASTQAVLGASTMADTGTFTTSVMNILLTFGMMVLGAGALSYAKEKKI